MNRQIIELAQQAGIIGESETVLAPTVEKFAELIVQHCIDVCEEMAAQCGGMPGDGALARDCANWIRKDFGVEE